MICLGIPIYNSSKVLENPLFKINLIIREIEYQTNEVPYILLVDDNSTSEETDKCLKIVKGMILPEFHNRVLYLKSSDNKGVFSSLNKMIQIITNKDKIRSSTKIKSVLFRDHDDYISSANIEASIKIAKEGVLGVPAIKLEVKDHDLEDFKIMSRSVKSLTDLKKRETLFINRFDIEKLMYFGQGASKQFFADDYKTMCVKDVPNYYQEYYDLFNTYALSAYNTKLFELLGGFDLYSMDSAGSKACDICALRILNLILKNILKKAEEYFITTEKVKEFNKDLTLIEKMEKSTRFAKLLFKPSIFRLVSSTSLSKSDLEDREFFYFTKLKQVINNRKGVYYELRNMKKAFVFLNSLETSEVVEFYLRTTKNIIQSLYTPIIKNSSNFEIVFRGDEWVFRGRND